MRTTPPQKPSPRQPLPTPSPLSGFLLAVLPTIISVAIWYRIEPMGRVELAASIALGVFVSLLGWGLYQVRRDSQKRVPDES
jgi:hypothetical protein